METDQRPPNEDSVPGAEDGHLEILHYGDDGPVRHPADQQGSEGVPTRARDLCASTSRPKCSGTVRGMP